MARTQKLEEWIREAVLDPDKPGRCTQLALVHMTGSGSVEEPIHARKLPDKLDDEIIADAADLFQRKAASYAQGLSGAQTFCLLAFYANESKPSAKHPFVEQGYTELDGLTTEGPSQKGFMQQMMRHNEGIISRGQAKDAHLFEALLKVLDLQQKEHLKLRQESVDNFAFTRELILQLSDRQHQQRMAEIESQNSANLKAQIAKWAPHLINAATGREIVPQSANDTQLVEGLIDCLAAQGDAAMPAIASLKPPPALAIAIADRFQRGMQARQHEQAVRRVADNESPDPEGLQ